MGFQGLIFSSLLGLALAEEEPSPVGVAVAATLLGAISFQMTLFYLLNHSDPDMRFYSYKVISSTISIFCAVLLFQSINGVLEVWLNLEEQNVVVVTIVDMLHMVFWFCMMQLALAKISGAIGSKPTDLKKMESQMKCWATLLAHMTGFAAINAWATVQQWDIFTSNFILSFVPIPLALAGLFCMQRVTDSVREKVSMGDDGEKDEFEEAWDEETEEAENDVMGLALSFLTVQGLRFMISGVMPNEEGQEEGKSAAEHSSMQVYELLAMGIVFIALMSYSIYQEPEEDEEHGHGAKTIEEHEANEKKKRLIGTITDTFGMTFAWCCFFGARWFFGSIKSLAAEPMVEAVALALFLSFVSFSVIRVLDKIADSPVTGEKADDIIKEIIGAIGILVGFAWEQSFDAAVDNLAEGLHTGYPALTKLAMAVFCVVLIVPAWRHWILPMVEEDGWRFGVVIEGEHQLEEMKKLLHEMEHKEHEEKKKKEKEKEHLKHLAEGHYQKMEGGHGGH